LETGPDLSPGAGQVLVRIHAAGVNPVDTYIRAGMHSVRPALPFTPGIDGAGIVAGAGEGVARFKSGDRVYVAGSVTGTYAEQALCLEKQVHRLPDGVTFAEGAAIGVPYATAYRALFQKACAAPGESLLVHGASGGVGVASVQLGRAAGLTVIGTAGSERGRELVRAQGAHHVLDHGSATYTDDLSRLTGGTGVDVILEMLANRNLGQDLRLLGRRGRVVVIGSRGAAEINPRDAMARDATIFGLLLFNTPDQELAAIHAALREALEKGSARPVIGREIPLADARVAHEAVMERGA
jgi:NADPH2:quinone reductase